MLTKEFRDKLVKLVKNDIKTAIKELELNPKLLELLLSDQDELERAKAEIAHERSERIKYINMTAEMERQLREQATRLQTTQGLLIGAGVFMLLQHLEGR